MPYYAVSMLCNTMLWIRELYEEPLSQTCQGDPFHDT